MPLWIGNDSLSSDGKTISTIANVCVLLCLDLTDICEPVTIVPRESVREATLLYQEDHLEVSVFSWLSAWSCRAQSQVPGSRYRALAPLAKTQLSDRCRQSPALPWSPLSPKRRQALTVYQQLGFVNVAIVLLNTLLCGFTLR